MQFKYWLCTELLQRHVYVPLAGVLHISNTSTKLSQNTVTSPFVMGKLHPYSK